MALRPEGALGLRSIDLEPAALGLAPGEAAVVEHIGRRALRFAIQYTPNPNGIGARSEPFGPGGRQGR